MSSLSSSPRSAWSDATLDHSVRLPVWVFSASAVLWLVLGGLLSLAAGVQLHWPEFLSGVSWLTHGRLAPAADTALLYGWALNAGLAFALWVMARLTRTALTGVAFSTVAGVFYNAGVTVAVLGTMAGDGTGLNHLSFPGYAAPALLIPFAAAALPIVLLFRYRVLSEVYASQWYLLAALFALPWALSTAALMAVFFPVRGVLQALVDTWYGGTVAWIVLVSLALASAYYFLPKLSGRPVRYYYQAAFAFWSFLFAAGFTVFRDLSGGPVPAWIGSVGIVGVLLLFVPVLLIFLNLRGLGKGVAIAPDANASYRLISFSVVAFLIFGLQAVAFFLRSAYATIQFTLFVPAQENLLLWGVVTPALSGALLYLLPRISGVAWPLAGLVRLQALALLVGASVVVVSLAVGGVQQGAALADAAVPFSDVVKGTQPWLTGATLGRALLLIGHLAFAANLLALLGRLALRRDVSFSSTAHAAAKA